MTSEVLKSLYQPLRDALLHLKVKWKEEKEYVLLGLVPTACVRKARQSTIRKHGLHLYHHLISASILDPEFIRSMAVREGFDLLYSPGFYGAVHINAFPQVSALPLYIAYLSSFPELNPGDYYELLGHWFPASRMVSLLSNLFFEAIHCKVPCDPEVIIKILSCDMYRPYVDWEELEHRWIVAPLDFELNQDSSSFFSLIPFPSPRYRR